MRTALDWIAGIAFVFGLCMLDAWLDRPELERKAAVARTQGIAEGAKQAALNYKCGYREYLTSGAK